MNKVTDVACAANFGGVVLISPARDLEFTAANWGDLDMAIIWNAEGQTDGARILRDNLERKLGVGEEHIKFVVNAFSKAAEPLAGFSDQVRELYRQAGEHDKKAATLAGSKNRDTIRARKEHETAAKLLRNQARDQNKVDQENAWAAAAHAETAFYAARRFETVGQETIQVRSVVRDEDGARILAADGPNKGEPITRSETIVRTRVASRGGLQSAYEAGALHPPRPTATSADHRGAATLYEVGQRYRSAYEVAEGLAKPSGGGKGGPDALTGDEILTNYGRDLALLRGRLKRQVSEAPIGDRLNDRQVRILDLVCGEDIALRVAAKTIGAGYPTAKNLLRAALKMARDNAKAEREG